MKATLLTPAGIALMLGAASCSSFAQAPVSQVGTLAGVGSVIISVNQPSSDLDAQGLSAATLTTYLTTKLTAAGIKVVTPATANFRSGGLEVTLTAVKASDEDAYALNLFVGFHQTVKLARNSAILADGVTWQRSDTTFATADSVHKYIGDIGVDVDAFIADYKSANAAAGGDKYGQGAQILTAPIAAPAR